MATFRTRTAKDGTTSVHTQVRLAGFPPRSASLPNMREAKKWAATIEAEMHEGRHYKDAMGRKRALAEAIKKFRAEVVPTMRDGAMYGFTLDWWETNHGTTPIGQVSRSWLSDARAQLLTGTFRRATPGSKRSLYKPGMAPETGSPFHTGRVDAPTYARTPATCNRYMAALSAVFSQVCGDWEWLRPNENPFTGFGKLQEAKNKGKAYTDDARAKLLQEAAKDPQLHRLCRVALGTLARAGELVGALTLSHVMIGKDDKGQEFGQLLFEDTKNGETRTAWLFGDALAAVKEQMASVWGITGPDQMTSADLSKPLFPGLWSHKAQKYGRYDYLPRLHKALAAAGLTMKRPFHALRHTGATTLARMGANLPQLKAAGGWKSDAANVYIHMAAEDTKAMAEQLAKRLASDTVAAGGK